MQMQTQLNLLFGLALVNIGASAANIGLPGCLDTCGNVSIPYPFGVGNSETGENCFLEEKLNLKCENDTLLIGNMQVIDITLEGHLDMFFYVSQLCSDKSNGDANEPYLSTPGFTISSEENKFISVGCESYGFLNSFYNGIGYSTGCSTGCTKFPAANIVPYGHCSGIGCCQVDIPPNMMNITIKAHRFRTPSVRSCSHSFIAKHDSYKFNVSHLENMPFTMLPIVVDWTVGNEGCEAFQNGSLKSACMNNSYCDDFDISYGYRCTCNPGYDGNPYHPNGCQDIDECKTKSHTCISENYCRNTDGHYECFCPPGQVGKGNIEEGCKPIQQESPVNKYAVGACIAFIALLIISWLYLIYHKRKLINQRNKFFLQNGGFILQQRLSTKQDSSQIAQIFTAEELKKATNNYDEKLIIGNGGYGTVFKGILANNKVVAIKKSKVVDQSQVEQFINEVVILSQINHRNVVKLLGCCLDTEVPLLVYEFVNNGTLFHHLHNGNKTSNVPWKTRLRIAIEAARALSYLHSDASTTIIHRDVKSANILLDDNYTAKVSDFGASRLVPVDQAELATLVQGTFGYLDPEYMQTSRLTEKSDVYSFGVVLVELLTGQKALSFQRSEEERSIAMLFLSSLENDNFFKILESGLLTEENKDEIRKVAVLASKCLSLKGEERPSMKEVSMELEGIIVIEKYPWNNKNLDLQESQYLHSNSNSYGSSWYDSMKDYVRIVLDVAR
ncbi:putative wall-associated receptor kinase-like 16 [Abrus precatorius]|uniref:Wall-associated receptor kinase-like 16 n=1 Tax=Abrus precatorius TaxID=3816 RepID=A0A8B8MID7_ABRPR|nr:putative wall-associated receptor kinase-like 16 [Abrus precatorius]